MKVYGYTRHRYRSRSGELWDPDRAAKQIREYARQLEPMDYCWGAMFTDAASSRSLPLLKRPQGFLLQRAVQPGDLVVFAEVACGFSNLRSFVAQVDRWAREDVGVCVLTPKLDTTTERSCLLETIRQLARFEEAVATEQAWAESWEKRQNGKSLGGNPDPTGYRWSGRPGRRRLVPDKDEQQVIEQLAKWRAQGYTAFACYQHLQEKRIRRRDGKKWSLARIERLWAQNATARNRKSAEVKV